MNHLQTNWKLLQERGKLNLGKAVKKSWNLLIVSLAGSDHPDHSREGRGPVYRQVDSNQVAQIDSRNYKTEKYFSQTNGLNVIG
ncbi:hypothetical protein IPZ59_19685 [Mongoliitalea daihaiensis]|nr:hypothetical protein [Mongoliitalea daihaiensis]UJP67169.1 hypothetical protein IPZ59_19685 [Mongoliitalea daihaiensis]